ncbi:telomere-associated protein RIF1 [Pelomyxa schiedti]|nr:telomere-associated protein RIF1 [Pelomyxa schiedti]
MSHGASTSPAVSPVVGGSRTSSSSSGGGTAQKKGSSSSSACASSFRDLLKSIEEGGGSGDRLLADLYRNLRDMVKSKAFSESGGGGTTPALLGGYVASVARDLAVSPAASATSASASPSGGGAGSGSGSSGANANPAAATDEPDAAAATGETAGGKGTKGGGGDGVRRECLHTLGYMLHIPSVVPYFTPQFATTLYGTIEKVLRAQESKTMNQLGLCASFAALAYSETFTFSCSYILQICTVLAEDKFNSTVVEEEGLNAMKQLLNQLKTSAGHTASVWGPQVYLRLFAQPGRIRQKAEEVVMAIAKIFPQPPGELSSMLAQDLTGTTKFSQPPPVSSSVALPNTNTMSLLDRFKNMWQTALSKSDQDMLVFLIRVWGYIIVLLGPSLTADLANKIFPFAQDSFGHPKAEVRKAIFKAWKCLISVYERREPSFTPTRIQVLMTPLCSVAPSEADQEVLLTCFQTWDCLCNALGSESLTLLFDTIVTPFINLLCSRSNVVPAKIYTHLVQVYRGMFMQEGVPTPETCSNFQVSGVETSVPVPPLAILDSTWLADHLPHVIGVLEYLLCVCSSDLSCRYPLLSVSVIVTLLKRNKLTFPKTWNSLLFRIGNVLSEEGLGDQGQLESQIKCIKILVGHVESLLSASPKKDSFPTIGDQKEVHSSELTQMLYDYIKIFLERMPKSLVTNALFAVFKIPDNKVNTDTSPMILYLSTLWLSCVPRLSNAEQQLHHLVFESMLKCLDLLRPAVQPFSLLLDKYVDSFLSQSFPISRGSLSLAINLWAALADHIQLPISNPSDVSLVKDFDPLVESTIMNALVVPLRILIKSGDAFDAKAIDFASQKWQQLYSSFNKWTVLKSGDPNHLCGTLALKIADILIQSGKVLTNSQILALCSISVREIVSSLDWGHKDLKQPPREQVIALSQKLLDCTHKWLREHSATPPQQPSGFSLMTPSPLSHFPLIVLNSALDLITALNKLCDQDTTHFDSRIPVTSVEYFSPALVQWFQDPKPQPALLENSCYPKECDDIMSLVKQTVFSLHDKILDLATKFCEEGEFTSEHLSSLASLINVGLNSKHRHMKNVTVQFWNKTFGHISPKSSPPLIYPPSLVPTLQTLQGKISLSLPFFPGSPDPLKIPVPPAVQENKHVPNAIDVEDSEPVEPANKKPSVSTTAPRHHLKVASSSPPITTTTATTIVNTLKMKKEDDSTTVQSHVPSRARNSVQESQTEYIAVRDIPTSDTILTDRQIEKMHEIKHSGIPEALPSMESQAFMLMNPTENTAACPAAIAMQPPNHTTVTNQQFPHDTTSEIHTPAPAPLNNGSEANSQPKVSALNLRAPESPGTTARKTPSTPQTPRAQNNSNSKPIHNSPPPTQLAEVDLNEETPGGASNTQAVVTKWLTCTGQLMSIQCSDPASFDVPTLQRIVKASLQLAGQCHNELMAKTKD